MPEGLLNSLGIEREPQSIYTRPPVAETQWQSSFWRSDPKMGSRSRDSQALLSTPAIVLSLSSRSGKSAA